jgi:hypothetical protein
VNALFAENLTMRFSFVDNDRVVFVTVREPVENGWLAKTSGSIGVCREPSRSDTLRAFIDAITVPSVWQVTGIETSPIGNES